MANYKISELGNTTVITDDDFFPVVDSGSSTTQRVDAQVVKEYMTGSVVNSLSASVLSGSDTYTTTLTSSYTTGSDAKLTTLSASFVTGSDAKLTTLSASFVTGSDAKLTSLTASSIEVDTIIAREYHTEVVSASIIYESGSTKFGDDSLDTHQFTGSILAGVVSGTTANFTTLNGNLDWSNVQSVPTEIANAAGTASNNTFVGVNTFNTHYVTASQGVTGSDGKFTTLSASYVTGSDAKFTSVSGSFAGNGSQITNITASNIDNFTADVRSQFTAGTNITINNGEISSSADTSLAADNTFTGINTFNQTITGSITGSVAEFTNLSGNLDWSYIVNEPTFLESNQVITLSGDATGSGATSIAIGDVTASFIKAGTDGSNLTSLTASQLSNFTNDVRAQFTAGTNITINNGQISASGGGTPGGANYSVQFNSGSSFSGSSDLTYNYDTSTLSGTIAEFSAITSSNHNSQSPAVFVNSAGVTGTTSAFTLQTDTSVTGYLFSLKRSTTEQMYVRYDGYTYIGDTLAVRNALLLSTPTFGSTQIASYRNYLKNARFIASGSSTVSAVRIGSENNSSTEKLLSVGRNLYNASPVDVVDVYGNGNVDVSGSLIANVRVSGSVASPISATSYTLSSADRGKTLLFSSSATQDITCSSGLDVGYNCTFVQMGSGQLILSGASGVELLNRQSHTGSAGQYAAVSVIVVDTDKIIIAGDTV
jgi:hypothetical protein